MYMFVYHEHIGHPVPIDPDTEQSLVASYAEYYTEHIYFIVTLGPLED